jgi:hypothetical protein
MSWWRGRGPVVGVSLLVMVVAAACARPVPLPQAVVVDERSFPRCDEVPAVALPAAHLRDQPIYVANEQPVEELAAWARSHAGFEELWIDRANLGWVVLAFSEDGTARQDELTDRFPDVGAVVVEVDWTMDELTDLQDRVAADPALRELGIATGVSVTQGVVSVELGELTQDRRSRLAPYLGERLCVSGVDPASLPSEGPQPQAGEGWRLLVDELAGEPYRTGIAADEEGLARLWERIGLTSVVPSVDLETEVVIWFGAVYGSSCPDLRLDDVVVDDDRALVYAEIIDVSRQVACTDDANPRAFVVAVERSRLPAGPFAIQLRADDPPPGAPEERTLVELDLTPPGASLSADAVGPDPSLAGPGPSTVGPGDLVEPGYPAAYRFDLHCGPEWLGPLNDVLWRSEVPDTPTAWREARSPSTDELVVEVLLETDPARLTATANGHEIVYTPTAEEHPGCD